MISAKPFDFPYDGNLEAEKTALIVTTCRRISSRQRAISPDRATTRRRSAQSFPRSTG